MNLYQQRKDSSDEDDASSAHSVGGFSALTTDSDLNQSRQSNSLLHHPSSVANSSTMEGRRRLDFSAIELYGRHKEQRELEEIFVQSKLSRQVIFVSGQAGSGKSSLVNTLRPLVSTGFFLVGK